MARTYSSESAEDIVRRNLRQIYAVKDTPPELRARITALLLEDGHLHVPLAQDSPNGGPCPRCGAARVVFDHDNGAAVYGCQECGKGERQG